MTRRLLHSYTWPVFVLLCAVLVAIVVMAVLNLTPQATPIPDGSITDGGFRPSELRGSVWVACLVSPLCAAPCEDALVQLSELRRSLPAEATLVSFAVTPGDTGAPSRSSETDGVWISHDIDIDRFRELAGHLGFSAQERDALVDDPEVILATTVDPAGRAHQPSTIAGGPGGGRVQPLLDDAEFLVALRVRPVLHAALNATSAFLLVAGFVFIRLRMVKSHRACMIVAALITLGFLVSYLYYHAHAGSVPFGGTGWIRPVYLGMLLTHTVLAAFVAPLAGTLFYLAARGRLDQHRRIARWTLPMWFYVSVTGVLIYFMLYVW